MRTSIRLVLSLVLGTALIVGLFTYWQTKAESQKLHEDLSLRANLVGTSFKATIEPYLQETESPSKIQKFIRQFKGAPRLIGTVVQLKDSGERVSFPEELPYSAAFKEQAEIAILKKQPVELFGTLHDEPVHFISFPLEKDGAVVGSLGLIHDRSYISDRIRTTWKHSAVWFSILAFVLSVTTLILIRWMVIGPLIRTAAWAKKVRGGKELKHPDLSGDRGEVDHLMIEVARMASSLKHVKNEAARSPQIQDMPDEALWTKDKLKDYLQEKLGHRSLYVVANREPYQHRKTKKGIECVVPPSGMVTALDPVLQATGGVWVGHGSGDADKQTADEKGRVRVPENNPSYTLKRVWLTDAEEKGYYFGFSNEGIWPLCHIAHTRPVFRLKDWKTYKKVNEKFANALLEEMGSETPYIIVQDYHFAILPKLIKEKRPDARVALFWHIPWPNPETFSICPWEMEILEGMLGSDLIGFHTQYHCNNFLDTVDRVMESRIDWNNFAVTRAGETTLVRPFPISIDPFTGNKSETEKKTAIAKIKKEFKLDGRIVGLGVDRIDYIKGILERFIAIDRFLEKYPEYRGKFVFVELGAPSRSSLTGYQTHLKAIERRVEKVNAKYGSADYKPIIFHKAHHSQDLIRDFYRLADFCLVNSLHDGMNLVAKEYVAGKEDLNGALILSQFTGASLELKSALQVNPYNIEETADAIREAIGMSPMEKRERMGRMRQMVREHNVFRWAAELITELVKSF